MKFTKIAALSAIALVATAASASAAPLAGLIKAPAAGNSVIPIHGRHDRCELGRNGWHRNPRHGVRIACRPSRPRGDHWSWRSEGSRQGWWDNRSRRWYR